MTKFSKLEYLKDLRGHKIPDGAYRILVEVFNYTDAHGKNAHPGESRLARDTCLSERSVRRHLKWLTDNGYLIKRSRGHGSGDKGIATVYDLPDNSVLLPTGQTAQPTGQPAQPTGQIASTNRTNDVDQPDNTVPLSDPLTDPITPDPITTDPFTPPSIDPEVIRNAEIHKLLESMRRKNNSSPSPCYVA